MAGDHTLKDSTLRIDLLRHGCCEDGAIYRGRTNSNLAPEGWSQMQRAVGNGGWETIYSSPLKRCSGFARHLAGQAGVLLVEDDRLQELDFGDWEGRSRQEVWSQAPQAVLDFWRDPATCSAPGGEALEAMGARVDQWFDEICQQHRGGRLLVVTHGGVIRLLMARVLATPLPLLSRLSVDYGSLTRIESYPPEEGYPRGLQLIFSNRLPEVQRYDPEIG